MNGIWIGILAICAVALPQVSAAQEAWTVQLTSKQAKALAEIAREPRPNVFALSPDGAWGWTTGMVSVEAARERALAFCRQHIRPGRRDCIIYAVNGEVVVGPTVIVPVVSQAYKPLHGKKAAAFFGLVDVSFQGNPAAAEAAFSALEANPAIAAQLPRDRTLTAALKGRTLTNAKAKYFGIWFDAGWGEQHSEANSGILVNMFEDWFATPDGLVCMLNSRWKPSGKYLGTRCIIIHDITRGDVQFSWAISPKVKRRGYVIAGNALYGAVR